MTLSDEEVLAFYEKLERHFGDKLPNYEHEPRRFANCVKLFRYYEKQHEANEKEKQNINTS